MIVRPATAIDAESGSLTLRRSIIAAWLANKTPENWLVWLGRPDASLIVAECGRMIVGVGMVEHAGVILLNYVSPSARCQGVSSAILRAMEDDSAQRGALMCTVDTTKTAERFYLARGFGRSGVDGDATLTKRLT